MNAVDVQTFETNVNIAEIKNDVDVKLMPMKTIILSLYMNHYMPSNYVEGVEMIDR